VALTLNTRPSKTLGWRTPAEAFRPVAQRIGSFLRERVSVLGDPGSIGDALKGGELGEFWKYRVGDWRLICEIRDKQILVTVLSLGNRREAYR